MRLGYELGFAAEFVGSFALSPAPVQARARDVGAPHVAAARALAARLGVGEVEPLPVRTLREFAELNQRYEADEAGLAARIEQQLSPLHRHLFLLGVQIGIASASIEGSGGKLASPPAALIRRHATLAGVAPALWEPLARETHGEAPAQVVGRYRADLLALGNALAAEDAAERPAQR